MADKIAGQVASAIPPSTATTAATTTAYAADMEDVTGLIFHLVGTETAALTTFAT